MGDIRDQLNARLQQLRLSAEKDAMWVRDGADPRSSAYERASRNLAELRQVEATLAAMQLADAQREVALAQREVAEQQRVANEAEVIKRSLAEESAFWARRFLTSITVANVGGLVAVLVFMSKPDSPLVPMFSADLAVRYFMAGAVLGGAYPLAKIAVLWTWRDRMRPVFAAIVAEYVLPGLATLALVAGTATATSAVFEMYEERAADTKQEVIPSTPASLSRNAVADQPK